KAEHLGSKKTHKNCHGEPLQKGFICLIASREAGTVHVNRGDTTNVLRSYCATKLYWITPVTLTGCPESLVGENLADFAAPTAAACNSGCPDTACAETTLPFSSIST